MLTYEEQERLDLLIENIENDCFDTVEYGDFNPESDRPKRAWQGWCEIWEYMERENNYSGSFGIKNDWMIINIVSELEEILYNSRMYQELLQLCEQVLKINWNGHSDPASTRQNMHENVKLMMADAYFSMGEKVKSIDLLRQYLNDDPLWGFGQMAYFRMLNELKMPEYEEVLEKLYQDLKDGTPYRDKEFVADALADAFRNLNEEEKADFCRNMSAYRNQHTVIKGPKIGRNDPCPCGSGKKYKKCCGK